MTRSIVGLFKTMDTQVGEGCVLEDPSRHGLLSGADTLEPLKTEGRAPTGRVGQAQPPFAEVWLENPIREGGASREDFLEEDVVEEGCSSCVFNHFTISSEQTGVGEGRFQEKGRR